MTDPRPNTLPLWFRGLAIVGALLAFAIAGLMVWQAGLPKADPDFGDLEPFQATTIDDQRIVVDANLDRPVIINFWATWCEPCIIEMPRLQQAANQYQDEGLLILGVNSAREDVRDVEVFTINQEITFPIIMDDDQRIHDAYNVRGIFPTTVFIDADGVVQDIIYGIVTEEALTDGLAQIGVDG